jgi:hypothetical protein
MREVLPAQFHNWMGWLEAEYSRTALTGAFSPSRRRHRRLRQSRDGGTPVPHQVFRFREEPATQDPLYDLLLAIWASSDDSNDPETPSTNIYDVSNPPHPTISHQMTWVIYFPYFASQGPLTDPGGAPPRFRRHYIPLVITHPQRPISTEAFAFQAQNYRPMQLAPSPVWPPAWCVPQGSSCDRRRDSRLY